MGVIDSLVGGVFGLIGGNQTNKANEKLNKEQMKFNAEQAEISRNWQEEMWNKANQYNSPVQQMQRLTEAGLNPNLVYGNGADATAAAVPSTQSANSGSLKPYQNSFGSAIQSAIMTNQLKLLEAQVNKTEQEAEKVGKEAEFIGIQNMHEDARLSAIVRNLELDADFNQATYNNRVSLSHFELDSAKVDNYIKNLNSLYLPEQLELSLRQGYQQLQNMVATGHLTYEQIKNLAANTWFIGKQVEVIHSEIVRNLAQANSANASAQASRAQAGYYGSLTQTENETREAKVYKLWNEGAFTNAQMERLQKMTPAELGKLVADTNKAYIEGNVTFLKQVSNRFGTGIIPGIYNTFYNIKFQDEFNKYYNDPLKPIGVNQGGASVNF